MSAERTEAGQRAVAYSRVSTEEEKQLHALAKQIKENREVIRKKGWVFAGEYIDEGKSGTQSKKREGYLRLFEDLEKDIFDIVVIKDQDRLMRNPKDWYVFVDRLLKNNKRLYIHLDQTFYNPDNGLLTGIKAILAEEYSRHLSRKINNAHKNRQCSGDRVIITNRTWGYKNTAGRIEIDETERGIIEQIFIMYANGMGSRLICRELSRRGIRNRKGNTLAESQIRAIVRNPLYMGTAVMNRTHINFDTKKKEKVPEEEWLYHENAVPAIVGEELWKAANKSMDSRRRTAEGSAEGERPRTAGRKRGVHLLSGKVVCGECGQSFWRNRRKNAGIVYWYCSEYYKTGKKEGKSGCASLRLKETELYAVLGELGDKLLTADIKKELQEHITERITSVLQEVASVLQEVTPGNVCNDGIEQIRLKKEKLLDLYLDGALEKEEYLSRVRELENRLSKAEEKERKAGANSGTEKEPEQERASALREWTENCNIAVPVVISHMERMLIYTDRIEVYFPKEEALGPFVFAMETEKGKRRFRLCRKETPLF